MEISEQIHAAAVLFLEREKIMKFNGRLRGPESNLDIWCEDNSRFSLESKFYGQVFSSFTVCWRCADGVFVENVSPNTRSCRILVTVRVSSLTCNISLCLQFLGFCCQYWLQVERAVWCCNHHYLRRSIGEITHIEHTPSYKISCGFESRPVFVLFWLRVFIVF